MNDDDSTILPDIMLEEASIWHARLNDTDIIWDEVLQKRFDAWLNSDPRCALALEEASSLWNILQDPALAVLAQDKTHTNIQKHTFKPRRRGWNVFHHRSPLAAIAACFLLFISTASLWQTGFFMRMRADYTTSVGQQSTVTLADGSTVILNTNSALSTDYTDSTRSVQLLAGEAWFDIAHDQNRPFNVVTDEGTVRVTGTKFNVALNNDKAVVSLTEGSVELKTLGTEKQQHAFLVPGYQATLSKTGISPSTLFDEMRVTAWKRKQLVFYDTPLAQVVSDLNKYRSGYILITNKTLKNLNISGVFQTDNQDMALDAIAKTLDVHITRLTNYLILIH